RDATPGRLRLDPTAATASDAAGRANTSDRGDGVCVGCGSRRRPGIGLPGARRQAVRSGGARTNNRRRPSRTSLHVLNDLCATIEPMATQCSFDVTSNVDLQEVDNALNQARKEVAQRYDFKGSKASIDFDQKELK